MYALAESSQDLAQEPVDPIDRELEAIEQLRRKALQSRDILHCSPIARHLVEEEIPRLVQIIRRFQRSRRGSVAMEPGEWTKALLLELQAQVSIVRDLVERH